MVVALALLAVAPGSAALAADVTSPRDGETVPAAPTFYFDIARGSAEFELSTSPDVKSAGPEAGAFVDREAGTELLIGRDEAGRAPWASRPLAAGRFYWHAQVRDRSNEFADPPATWTPVRVLVVADEPPVLEGWTFRARALRRRRDCRTPVNVSGRFAFSDNVYSPPGDYRPATATYSLALRSGGKTVRVSGRVDAINATYSRVACLAGRTAEVVATLRDPAGHVVTSPPRRVTLPGR